MTRGFAKTPSKQPIGCLESGKYGIERAETVRSGREVRLEGCQPGAYLFPPGAPWHAPAPVARATGAAESGHWGLWGTFFDPPMFITTLFLPSLHLFDRIRHHHRVTEVPNVPTIRRRKRRQMANNPKNGVYSGQPVDLARRFGRFGRLFQPSTRMVNNWWEGLIHKYIRSGREASEPSELGPRSAGHPASSPHH